MADTRAFRYTAAELPICGVAGHNHTLEMTKACAAKLLRGDDQTGKLSEANANSDARTSSKRNKAHIVLHGLPHACLPSTLGSLNRTGRLREDSVGVGPDQPHGTNDKDHNHSQHDRVFRDVLALVVEPCFPQNVSRHCSIALYDLTIELPVVIAFEFGN